MEYAAPQQAMMGADADGADDQAAWDVWSETVGISAVQVPCPISGCGREVTALVERWAEGEPPHEQVAETVTFTEGCPVHPAAALTAAQMETLTRAAFV
jgi:hypothetical protein